MPDDPKAVIADINELYELWQKARDSATHFRWSDYFDTRALPQYESQYTWFLYDLLRPNGPRGLGGRALKIFLDSLKIEIPYPPRIAVQREVDTQTGRPDLVITWSAKDGKKSALVFENKPFAGEGENQLQRYAQYLTCYYPGTKTLVYAPGYFDEGLMSKFDDLGSDFCGVDFFCVPYSRKHKALYGSLSPISIEELLERLLEDSNIPSEARTTIEIVLQQILQYFGSGDHQNMTTADALKKSLKESPALLRKADEIHEDLSKVVEEIRNEWLQEISQMAVSLSIDQLGLTKYEQLDAETKNCSLHESWGGPFVRSKQWPAGIGVGVQANWGHAPLYLTVFSRADLIGRENWSKLKDELRGRLESENLKGGRSEGYISPWSLRLTETLDEKSAAELYSSDQAEKLAGMLSDYICKIARHAESILVELKLTIPVDKPL